jgi:hypothetical protein
MWSVYRSLLDFVWPSERRMQLYLDKAERLIKKAVKAHYSMVRAREEELRGDLLASLRKERSQEKTTVNLLGADCLLESYEYAKEIYEIRKGGPPEWATFREPKLVALLSHDDAREAINGSLKGFWFPHLEAYASRTNPPYSQTTQS